VFLLRDYSICIISSIFFFFFLCEMPISEKRGGPLSEQRPDNNDSHNSPRSPVCMVGPTRTTTPVRVAIAQIHLEAYTKLISRPCMLTRLPRWEPHYISRRGGGGGAQEEEGGGGGGGGGGGRKQSSSRQRRRVSTHQQALIPASHTTSTSRRASSSAVVREIVCCGGLELHAA
jgi:hypothetical protein